MKKIIKAILIVLPILIVHSCVDDDKLFELDDFETGAIANMVPTANDDGFINLLDLSSTVIEYTVDFSIDFAPSDDGGITTGGDGRVDTNLEWSKVASFDLYVRYQNAVTGDFETAAIGNYTSWPATVNLTVSDLTALIPSLDTDADYNLGDQFVFTTGINFQDGRAYPAFINDANGNPVPNYSVNFAGAGNNPGINFALTYNVACPSDIPTAGTWTGTTQQGAFGVFSSNPTITITALGAGKYTISDVTGGFYAAFGFNTDQPVTFEDVCNSLTIIDNGNAQFDIGTDAGAGFPAGTWDPVTETITFPWYDAGNGFGDATVFTRN